MAPRIGKADARTKQPDSSVVQRNKLEPKPAAETARQKAKADKIAAQAKAQAEQAAAATALADFSARRPSEAEVDNALSRWHAQAEARFGPRPSPAETQSAKRVDTSVDSSADSFVDLSADNSADTDSRTP